MFTYVSFFRPDLAEFETGKSQVATVISAAASYDNICRMDPAWNPWV